jgi:Putative Actinobacterial Holin-X, holin superfamily III
MPRQGLGGTVSDLAADTSRLVQLEIELLRQELTALVRRNAIAIAMIAAAALSALLFFIFLLVFLVEVLPIAHWITALVITAVFLVLAILLALVGRSRIKIAAPEASIQSIKEDLEWVKQQIRPETR